MIKVTIEIEDGEERYKGKIPVVINIPANFELPTSFQQWMESEKDNYLFGLSQTPTAAEIEFFKKEVEKYNNGEQSAYKPI